MCISTALGYSCFMHFHQSDVDTGRSGLFFHYRAARSGAGMVDAVSDVPAAPAVAAMDRRYGELRLISSAKIKSDTERAHVLIQRLISLHFDYVFAEREAVEQGLSATVILAPAPATPDADIASARVPPKYCFRPLPLLHIFPHRLYMPLPSRQRLHLCMFRPVPLLSHCLRFPCVPLSLRQRLHLYTFRPLSSFRPFPRHLCMPLPLRHWLHLCSASPCVFASAALVYPCHRGTCFRPYPRYALTVRFCIPLFLRHRLQL